MAIITGTNGNDDLIGVDGENDQIFPLNNVGLDRIFATTGNDEITLMGGGDNFFELNYERFDGIDIDLGAGTIDKRASNGVDTLVGFFDGPQASFRVTATDGDDSFISRDMSAYAFYEVRDLGGNDSFIGTRAVEERISYRLGAPDNGVVANLSSSSVATAPGGTIAARTIRDPYGGIDTVNDLIDALETTDNADFIVGNDLGNDFRPRGGNDTIDGGDGFDQVRYSNSSARIVADLRLNQNQIIEDGFGGADTLISVEAVRGGNFDDILDGGNEVNRLRGEGGNDVLRGNGGDATRWQGNRLEGGTGNDQLVGTQFNDALDGGAGDDIIVTGASSYRPGFGASAFFSAFGDFDRVFGSAGNDDITIEVSGDGYVGLRYFNLTAAIDANLQTGVIVKGAQGTDSYTGLDSFDSEDGAVQLIATRYDDTLRSRDLNDAGLGFFDLEGGPGSDTIIGAGSYDRYSLFNTSDGEDLWGVAPVGGARGNFSSTDFSDGVTIAANTVFDPFGGTDSVSGIESVSGTEFDDFFVGSEIGSDLYGRDNAFEFRPEGGNDTLVGRAPNNIVRYSLATNSVEADLSLTENQVIRDGFGGSDNLVNINQVRSGSGNDSLSGDDNENFLRADGGADLLRGRGGDDILTGGSNVNAAFIDQQVAVSNFGRSQGWTDNTTTIRTLADLDDDGLLDIVAFGNVGVLFARGNGDGTFQDPTVALDNFGLRAGWANDSQFPRQIADVNGDGVLDIIGFGTTGVLAAFGNGDGTFQAAQQVFDDFTTRRGWTDDTVTPRFVEDVTGDGFADLVGFGNAGMLVAAGTGDGSFDPVTLAVANFGLRQGWNSTETNERLLADLNNDGVADILGFGLAGALVALADGAGGFDEVQLGIANFGTRAGWVDQDRFPRQLVDIDGDGNLDLVGFGNAGMLTALGNGDGTFANATLAVANFGANRGWSSDETLPRVLADVNGDGLVDVMGFGNAAVLVALNQGGTFSEASVWVDDFALANGYGTQTGFPRLVGDVTGDGASDIVAFGNAGVLTALSNKGGGDRFVFDAADFGNDTITDFAAGDILDMRGSGATFNTLTIADNGQGDTVISTADNSSITLTGVATSSIDASDFLF